MTAQAEVTVTDLTACEREPIHVPGAIQPHGFLLGAEPGSWVVQHASENVATVLGCAISQVLGRTVFDVLPESATSGLRAAAANPLFTRRPIFVRNVSLAGRLFALIAHMHRGTIIVEGEALDADTRATRHDPHYELEQFLSRIEATPAMNAVLTLAAAETRRLTGFDRVLIYRFDPGWNGIVMAEDRNDVLPSYLDLRFPASDIPQQARELYRVNRLRLIASADYQPVRVVAAQKSAPLDLSLSTLRSVSPVHREYMRNMGTGSSMSISLMRGGELWGLISCHSRAPRVVPFDVRATCELLGQVLSLQLGAREEAQAFQYRMQLKVVLTRLLGAMGKHSGAAAGLMAARQDLLTLTNAAGVAVVMAGSIEMHGRTPTKRQVEALIGWLQQKEAFEVLALDALPTAFPAAEEYSWAASGLLAVRISRVHESFVLWFRPEVVSTVTWGGDPAKPVQTGPDGAERLHPRKSFEAWVETVRGRAQPWVAPEVEAARELRTGVIDIVLQNAERLASLTDELTRTNKELEAFSYTVSHDLRAPFRHIRAYAELLKAEKNELLDAEGREFLDHLLNGASYAGRMVDNILAFSQMGRTPLQIVDVQLNSLVNELLPTIRLSTGTRDIRWEIGPLPTVPGDASLLRTAFQNLIENAVKFTRERPTAQITIRATESATEQVISIQDNGAGFDMQYRDKLFGMFQRLHRWEEFEGTGIGLASVRRIVARHGGRVWADAAVGKGATFHVALPKTAIATSPLYA